MDKKIIILAIAGGLIIFVLGGGLGVMYKSQQAELQKQNTIIALSEKLQSKVLSPLTASGNVVVISGREITLSQGGSVLAINIASDAKITRFSYASGSTVPDKNSETIAAPTFIQTEVDFGNIKIGDKLSANLKILEDGTLSSQLVVITAKPPASDIKTK